MCIWGIFYCTLIIAMKRFFFFFNPEEKDTLPLIATNVLHSIRDIEKGNVLKCLKKLRCAGYWLNSS